METYKCHKCLSYSCINVNNGYLCKECNVLFSSTTKKSSKSKTFNNKKIHFNNVMKDISKQYNIEDIMEIIYDSIEENNIEKKFINQSLICSILKKNSNKLKDYKMVYNILNKLENNEKKIYIPTDMKNNIEILFLSFINFLYSKNKLDSISYNLILSNMFKLYGLNNTLKPTVKDEKEDLWNMFIYTITNNYFNNVIEVDKIKYTNYKPKMITNSLYKIENSTDYQ